MPVMVQNKVARLLWLTVYNCSSMLVAIARPGDHTRCMRDLTVYRRLSPTTTMTTLSNNGKVFVEVVAVSQMIQVEHVC